MLISHSLLLRLLLFASCLGLFACASKKELGKLRQDLQQKERALYSCLDSSARDEEYVLRQRDQIQQLQDSLKSLEQSYQNYKEQSETKSKTLEEELATLQAKTASLHQETQAAAQREKQKAQLAQTLEGQLQEALYKWKEGQDYRFGRRRGALFLEIELKVLFKGKNLSAEGKLLLSNLQQVLQVMSKGRWLWAIEEEESQLGQKILGYCSDWLAPERLGLDVNRATKKGIVELRFVPWD